MAITIKKIQEIIDDEPQEARYRITVERKFKAAWVGPEIFFSQTLYEDELEEVRDAINKVLEGTNSLKS